MNNKININPSSTKWLKKDDRVVADYFCDLGFRSLKQILDMRVFDLMNSDFVFVNRNGEVQHQGTLNKALQRIMVRKKRQHLTG